MHKKIWFLFLTIFLDMLGIGILIPVIPQLLGEPKSPYYLLSVSQSDTGLPSTLPWSIPIDFAHRPRLYEAITYFHPTFLYESIAMLFVFGILYYLATKKTAPRFIIGTYLIAYGLVRFLLEFIKIDTTPIVLGLRWPQLVSLVMIAGAITMFTIKKVKP